MEIRRTGAEHPPVPTPHQLLSTALGAHNLAERIAAIEVVRKRLNESEQQAAFECRSRGESWTQVGARWGITADDARDRFGHPAGWSLDSTPTSVDTPA